MALRFFAPNAVWQSSMVGDVIEGQAAIRGHLVDWRRVFGDVRFEVEEIADLGNGVVLVANRQRTRVGGSDQDIEGRYAFTYEWSAGLIVGITVYTDINEARAAAERLAESRE